MTTPQVILNVRYDDDPTVYHVLYRPDSQGEDLNRKVNTLFESKYPDGEFEIFVDLSPEGVTPRVRIDKGGIADCLPPTEDGTRFVHLDCFLKKVAAPVQSTSPPTAATGRKPTAAEQGLWDRWTAIFAAVCVASLKVFLHGDNKGTFLPMGQQPDDSVKLVIWKMRKAALDFHTEYKNSHPLPHPKENIVCGHHGYTEVCEAFWKRKIVKRIEYSRKWTDEQKNEAISAQTARNAAVAAAAARRASVQPAGTPAQGQQMLAGLRRDSPQDEGARRERSMIDIPRFTLALPSAPTGAADADTVGGTAGLVPAADAAGGSVVAGGGGPAAAAAGAAGASAACAAAAAAAATAAPAGGTASAAPAADLAAGDATGASPSLGSPAGDGNGGSEELPGAFDGAFIDDAMQRAELVIQDRRIATAANQSARVRAQRSNDDEQEDAAFKQALEDSKDSAVSVISAEWKNHAAAVRSSITPLDKDWFKRSKEDVKRFIQGALQKLDIDSYKEKFGDFHVNAVKVGVELGILPANRQGGNWRGVTSTWQLWLKKYLAHHNPVADPADVADDIPAAPAAADDAPAAPAADADAPAAPDDAPDAGTAAFAEAASSSSDDDDDDDDDDDNDDDDDDDDDDVDVDPLDVPLDAQQDKSDPATTSISDADTDVAMLGSNADAAPTQGTNPDPEHAQTNSPVVPARGVLQFWRLTSKKRRIANTSVGKGRYVHQYGFYFVGVENCNDYDLAEAGRDTPDGWYPNE